MYLFTLVESGTCVTLKKKIEFKKKLNAFLCFHNDSLVRDGRNYLHPREYQGDEQPTVTFHTTSEIMADVSTYDQRELVVIFFNQLSNILSVGSGDDSTWNRVLR